MNATMTAPRRGRTSVRVVGGGAVTSDKSVHRATGYTWEEWFGILDDKGASKLPHKEIAAFLKQEHELEGWWSQMITVSYERARGLRVKNQKCDGSFSANLSRTVAVPLDRLYETWANAELQRKWFPGAPLQVRKATKNKSLRIAWKGGESRVTVDFTSKGAAKSQVTLGHEKLSDLAAVDKMKKFWGEALERMKMKTTLAGPGKETRK